MKKDSEEMINSILNNLSTIKSEDIPGIDLYMDQVTTFMDRHLSSAKRFKDDKILTKTMINNYTKNDLLPPPDKKKYSKDHVLMLIFIYYLKNILSINDIKTILNPIGKHHFQTEKNLSMEDIYKEVLSLLGSRTDMIRSDIFRDLSACESLFENCNPEEQDFLQVFALIASLAFDVYVKKQVIEGIIDQLNAENAAAKTQEKEEAAEKAAKEKAQKEKSKKEKAAENES